MDKRIGRTRLIENSFYKIYLVQFLELSPVVAVRQVIEQKRHGVLDGIHHFVWIPIEIFIIVRVSDEVTQSLPGAAPIRPEHGIYGKALIAFIVSKHTILEELIGLFGPG